MSSEPMRLLVNKGLDAGTAIETTARVYNGCIVVLYSDLKPKDWHNTKCSVTPWGDSLSNWLLIPLFCSFLLFLRLNIGTHNRCCDWKGDLKWGCVSSSKIITFICTKDEGEMLKCKYILSLLWCRHGCIVMEEGKFRIIKKKGKFKKATFSPGSMRAYPQETRLST